MVSAKWIRPNGPAKPAGQRVGQTISLAPPKLAHALTNLDVGLAAAARQMRNAHPEQARRIDGHGVVEIVEQPEYTDLQICLQFL